MGKLLIKSFIVPILVMLTVSLSWAAHVDHQILISKYVDLKCNPCIFMFSLWDAPKFGNEIWYEGGVELELDGKYIDYYLGSDSGTATSCPLYEVDFSEQMWVQVEVKSDEEEDYEVVGEREKLNMGPYSAYSTKAGDANTLDGRHAGDFEDADAQLQQSIDDEASERESADAALDISIADEAGARAATDGVLQQSILNEVAVREQVDQQLKAQIESIELTPGPPGAEGQPGLACWDLNANGECDPSENTNNDETCDAQDCQGPEGLPGGDANVDMLSSTICTLLYNEISASPSWNDIRPLLESSETCDGLDNDCDGTIDNISCETGLFGVCASGFLDDCTDEQASCIPTPPDEANDVTCDGIDGDCDGATDEDYIITDTTCGSGACSSTGQLDCISGSEVDSCTPGAQDEATDVTCDGIDGDCDGATDEDYIATTTTCGVGFCEGNQGQLVCQNGAEVDTCNPLAGARLESSHRCNNIDDDCDGESEYEYPYSWQNTTKGGVSDVGECWGDTAPWWGDTCEQYEYRQNCYCLYEGGFTCSSPSRYFIKSCCDTDADCDLSC